MILRAAAGFSHRAAPVSRGAWARASFNLAVVQPERRLPLVVARSVAGVGGGSGDATAAPAEIAAIEAKVKEVGDEIRAMKADKASKEVLAWLQLGSSYVLMLTLDTSNFTTAEKIAKT